MGRTNQWADWHLGARDPVTNWAKGCRHVRETGLSQLGPCGPHTHPTLLTRSLPFCQGSPRTLPFGADLRGHTELQHLPPWDLSPQKPPHTSKAQHSSPPGWQIWEVLQPLVLLQPLQAQGPPCC